jgi:hypothetical protein
MSAAQTATAANDLLIIATPSQRGAPVGARPTSYYMTSRSRERPSVVSAVGALAGGLAATTYQSGGPEVEALRPQVALGQEGLRPDAGSRAAK